MLPIVLHHGLLGYEELRLGPIRIRYFQQVERALRELGHPVITTGVHPTAGIETRARQLKEQVLTRLSAAGFADQPFIIVAHSMGGLDARWMTSRLGMARQVAALLTVATPHRGSPYADWIFRNLADRFGMVRLAARVGLDLAALPDLTTASCAKFNDAVPDDPGVRYFSIGCARPFKQMPAFAMHAHHVIAAADGDNDGLVSLRSAAWGRPLGVWPVDHWQSINRDYALLHRAGDVSARYVQAVGQVATELRAGRAALAAQGCAVG